MKQTFTNMAHHLMHLSLHISWHFGFFSSKMKVVLAFISLNENKCDNVYKIMNTFKNSKNVRIFITDNSELKTI